VSQDALRVDFLATEGLPAGGALGLCQLPGRNGVSATGVVWARVLGDDLRTLSETEQVDRLVCLLEDHELSAYGVPTLIPEAQAAGLSVTRFPIADGTVPRGGPPELLPLVTTIVTVLRAGERVVIHCVAGMGRTGLVAGCVLVALGMKAPEALALLTRARGPACPETAAQRWCVDAYANEIGPA